MNIEEIKSKIQFSERDSGRIIEYKATLNVAAFYLVSKQERLLSKESFKKVLQEELKHMILRELFDDNRKEIHEALIDIIKQPNVYCDYDKVNKLVKLCGFTKKDFVGKL